MIWELSPARKRGCRLKGRECSAYGVHPLNFNHSQKAGFRPNESPVNLIILMAQTVNRACEGRESTTLDAIIVQA